MSAKHGIEIEAVELWMKCGKIAPETNEKSSERDVE